MMHSQTPEQNSNRVKSLSNDELAKELREPATTHNRATYFLLLGEALARILAVLPGAK